MNRSIDRWRTLVRATVMAECIFHMCPRMLGAVIDRTDWPHCDIMSSLLWSWTVILFQLAGSSQRICLFAWSYKVRIAILGGAWMRRWSKTTCAVTWNHTYRWSKTTCAVKWNHTCRWSETPRACKLKPYGIRTPTGEDINTFSFWQTIPDEIFHLKQMILMGTISVTAH